MKVARIIHAMDLTAEHRNGDFGGFVDSFGRIGMATKLHQKMTRKVDEHNFAELDGWARDLDLEDGRRCHRSSRRDHDSAKRVRPGRPSKPPGVKSGRYMVSMDPALHQAAVKFSRFAKVSLSGAHRRCAGT